MKLIWSNGAFDLIHSGHLRLLRYARSLGDKLVVGLDTDEKITKDKGVGRPIRTLEERREMLKALDVDEVVSFGSKEELRDLIKIFRPDIMVIGSDYQNKEVVGREFAKNVIFFERIEGSSTTELIQRIVNKENERLKFRLKQ